MFFPNSLAGQAIPSALLVHSPVYFKSWAANLIEYLLTTQWAIKVIIKTVVSFNFSHGKIYLAYYLAAAVTHD